MGLTLENLMEILQNNFKFDLVDVGDDFDPYISIRKRDSSDIWITITNDKKGVKIELFDNTEHKFPWDKVRRELLERSKDDVELVMDVAIALNKNNIPFNFQVLGREYY